MAIKDELLARLPETTRASFGPQVTNPQLIITRQRNYDHYAWRPWASHSWLTDVDASCSICVYTMYVHTTR